ncbi:hypothetical protein [Legionella antarctica]|nr:hypothetical protein [Legionella antarctica]
MMCSPHFLTLDKSMNELDEHTSYRLLTEHLHRDNGIGVIVNHDLSWIEN